MDAGRGLDVSCAAADPRRLAYVARLYRQTLLDTTVGRHGGQHAAPADFGGVEHHAAVGGEAGGFVLGRVGEDLGLAGGEVEQGDLEAPAVAGDVNQALAVGRGARADVVAASKLTRWASPPPAGTR
jgi:hypothetical protein